MLRELVDGKIYLSQQLGLLSLLRNQRHSLLIEGNEDLASQPIALIGDQSIGEVSAFIQNRQAGIYGRTIDGYIAGVEQGFERGGNVLLPEVVDLTQNPNELAQAWNGNGNEFGFLENLRRCPRLFFIITHHRANQYVCIDRDIHFRPAQPLAAASLISSRVATFLVLPASRPTKLSIFPEGLAARSDIRPSGSLSN